MTNAVPHRNSQLGANFAALFIGVYALFSAPFVFFTQIPYGMRVGLEIAALSAVTIFVISRNISVRAVEYMLIWLMLVTLTLLYTQTSYETVIRTSICWLYFLIFAAEVDNLRKLNNLIAKSWFWIWMYISITVVIGFALYRLELVKFDYVDFGAISTADYTYYNNIYFGNTISVIYWGENVQRMCWYIFEPGMLAFFLGLNVIITKSVYASYEYKKLFMGLNFVAGCLTFSTTYIMFFLGWILYGSMRRIITARAMLAMWGIFLVATICVAYFVVANDLLASSSIEDRLLRANIALDIANNNSLPSFLFGNGVGISSVVADRGISSGLANVFIERGFLILAFLSFIIYKYAQSNKMLVIYIAFSSLAIEPVWYPAFLIALYIVFAASKTLPGKVNCQQNSIGEN